MKAVCSYLKSAAILLLAFLLIFQTNDAKPAIQEGLRLCASSVLPALFPFFVLSDLWIRSGAAEHAAVLFTPVMEAVFHLPGASASALLLGSFGGYPVGARTAAQLYRDGILSREAAEQVLLFCNNAGPSFIIGVVGYGVFHSAAAGILLYVIHLLCAMGTGLLLRPKETGSAHPVRQRNPEAFLTACKNAIMEGGKTAVTVCTFILFFSVITSCVSGLLAPSLFSALAVPGLLEITSGFHALSMAALHPRITFAISSLLLGLGGCCVIMQAVAFTEAAGLSCKKMLIGKGLQGISGAAIAYLLWPVLPAAQPCMNTNTRIAPTAQWLVFLLLGTAILLFLKKSSGKMADNLI